MNYTVFPDAKRWYFEMPNTLILNLTVAYKSRQFTLAKLRHALEKSMDDMRQMDPHLKGSICHLHNRKKCRDMAPIDLMPMNCE